MGTSVVGLIHGHSHMAITPHRRTSRIQASGLFYMVPPHDEVHGPS